MQPGFYTFIGFILVVMGGISFLLFSPNPSTPELTLKETAQFLEKNPNLLEPKQPRVEQARVPKTDPQISFTAPLEPTPFEEAPIVAAGNLKQSFLLAHPNAISERMLLLDSAYRLSQASGKEDSTSKRMTRLMAEESEVYLEPFLQSRNELGNPDNTSRFQYGERALQLYLMSEKNTEEAKEQMERMKIPVIDLRKNKP